MQRMPLQASASESRIVREHGQARDQEIFQHQMIAAERAARLGKARAALKAALARLAKGERKDSFTGTKHHADLPIAGKTARNDRQTS